MTFLLSFNFPFKMGLDVYCTPCKNKNEHYKSSAELIKAGCLPIYSTSPESSYVLQGVQYTSIPRLWQFSISVSTLPLPAVRAVLE